MEQNRRSAARGDVLIACSWLIMLLTGFGNLSLGLLMPALREQFGFGLETAGNLNAVKSAVQLLSTVPLAVLSARVSPRYVLGGVFASVTVSFLLMGFAGNVTHLYLSMALFSVALGGTSATMAQVKSSWVPLERLDRVNAMESFMNTAGQIIATTLLAGIVALLGGWQRLELLLAGLGAAATIVWCVMFSFNPQNMPPRPGTVSVLAPVRDAVREKSTWLISAGYIGTTSVWLAFMTFWPTYAIENLQMSVAQAGLAIGMLPVGAAVACIASPCLARLVKNDKLMYWPWGIYLCVVYYLSLQISGVGALCVVFFAVGFGAFVFVPVANTFLFKLDAMNPAAITVAYAVTSAISNGSGLLSGLFVGRLSSVISLKAALTWCCLSPAIMFVCGLFLPDLRKKLPDCAAQKKLL